MTRSMETAKLFWAAARHGVSRAGSCSFQPHTQTLGCSRGHGLRGSAPLTTPFPLGSALSVPPWLEAAKKSVFSVLGQKSPGGLEQITRGTCWASGAPGMWSDLWRLGH